MLMRLPLRSRRAPEEHPPAAPAAPTPPSALNGDVGDCDGMGMPGSDTHLLLQLGYGVQCTGAVKRRAIATVSTS